MKRVKSRAVLILIVMAAVSLLLVAQPTPANARTITADSCQLNYEAIAVLGNKKYAESFTPVRSGKITSGTILTYNTMEKPANYVVEIWKADLFGIPTGSAALSSTTVNHPHQGYDFLFPTFSSPAKVTAGNRYALVVTVEEPTLNGVTIHPDNLCPGTFSLNQSGSGTFAADASGRDMVFLLKVTFRRHHRH
jgi:hypothetical protein